MSYLVLARKFRPQDFKSISGQEQVTRPLSNSIKRGTVSHAFLFCGPRGVGKTTVARVLAKALNCKDGPTSDPCLECTNCVEITHGRSLAVREIDGASHNSVDNVRDLIDTLRSQPPPGSKFKVYIIDEVHMLSTAAFNALLKNLEEPPPNTVFILATTDPQKIPDTVISRCQRYDFRSITPQVIEGKLAEIAKAEKIKAEPEVFAMISRLADGSMRDAQSLLDRVRSLSDGTITAEETSQALGVVNKAVLFSLSQSVLAGDPDKGLSILDQIFSSGLDPKLFLNELVSHWRELLIAKFSGENNLKRLGLNKDQNAELLSQVKDIAKEDLQDLVYLVQTGCDAAIRSLYPRMSIEALIVRLATREKSLDLAQVISDLKKKVLSEKVLSEKVISEELTSPKKVAEFQQNETHDPSQNLNWRDFVSMVSKSGRSAMPECLKHLSVERFEPGVLKAIAPKLALEYFNDKENKVRLVDYLNNFLQSSKWDVTISNSAGRTGLNGASLVEEDAKHKAKVETGKRDNAAGHPAVQNIKKFFPGTSFDA